MGLAAEFLVGIRLIIVLLIFYDNPPTVSQWLKSINANRGFVEILN
jgi:hypothetical protein